MAGLHESEIQRFFPTANFTDAEAAQHVSGDGEIVSLMARRRGPDQFVVAFATRQGRIGPYTLDRSAATLLRELLQRHGF